MRASVGLAFGVLAFAVCSSASGQEKVYAQTTRTLAQALVEQLPRSYPEVEYAVMHARLPGGQGHGVIASHRLGQVGEVDGESDISVIDDHCIIVHPHAKDNFARCVVRVPMKNSAGEYIAAAWAISFYSKRGDNLGTFLTRAEAIRDEMEKRIPSLAALYEPAP